MREFTVPAAVAVPEGANLADTIFDKATSNPTLASLSRRIGDSWVDVTARQFADEVQATAKGLVTTGIQPGDRVGLMSKTRYEWTVLDYAIWSVGAVTVPVYETSSAEQVQWILRDSGAVGCVVETAEHEATVDSVRDSLPDLKNLWRIEGDAIRTLVQQGREVPDEEILRRRAATGPDHLATIIYTSGTTGRPKGCQLTHRNLLSNVLNSTAALDKMFHDTGKTLLFLPLAHVFARIIQCGALYRGVQLAHSANIKTLMDDLKVFQPTFVLSVPRVFEKVYNGAKQKALADGKGRIFDRAEQVAIDYSRGQDAGWIGVLLRAQHALFDKLVYTKLRAALGGQCIAAMSGGAPLGERLGHFFRGVGITIYEGYGLTETAPVVTVNIDVANKIGTVGRPIPGETVRIADDGEILVKGENIFGGYWHNDEATRDVIDADGWFHTGDLGELDSDGYLKVTGRKKELIVTAGGKNVAPAVLEDRLRGHWLISQAMVVGDRRPFIGALITIDPESFPKWKQQHAKPDAAEVVDLRNDPDLLAEVQAAVDDANKAVSKAESIRKFRVLGHDFTEATGELTPSLKLRRHVVLKEYASDVEAIYSA